MGLNEATHRAALLKDGSMLSAGGPSYLEENAVKLPTQRDYRRRVSSFEEQMQISALTMALVFLEIHLLEFFDLRFVDGADSTEGWEILAALCFFRPAIKGCLKTGGFSRAKLAPTGWTRIAPSAARLPLPQSLG